MYSRGIEFVKPKGNNGFTKVADSYYKIPDNVTVTQRVGVVVPGSVIVQCVAGSNATVDAAVSANTTGTPGRKTLGIAATVCTPMGVPIPRNQVALTEAGTTTLIPARGNVFRCMEDGNGGNISDADSNGTFASLVISAPTFTSDSDSFTPNPEAEIKIGSNTISGGTAANRAIRLLGVDPSFANTTGKRAFLFEFTDAFTEPIS